jgi:antitoxin CptB
MTDDTEFRRRRAAWRAAHRGTKELDLMIGRYAEATLGQMAEEELRLFERFLEVSDADLQHWLFAPDASAEAEFAGLAAAVRQFHGLK